MSNDEVLKAVSAKLEILLASATPMVTGDDNEIVGYQIKTGALHAIIGFMQATDYPVTVPVHKNQIKVSS